MQSAGSGLSDILSGIGPQGSSPSVAGGRTDLLGRALSSNKQDSFDFIGVSISSNVTVVPSMKSCTMIHGKLCIKPEQPEDVYMCLAHSRDTC